jgi:predicted porin
LKTALYSTTALAAAAAVSFGATDASAQMKKAERLSIGVGGYFQAAIGFSDNDSAFETATGQNFRAFNQYNESEVYFRGNTRLDNGIRVDVVIQLETDQARANTGTVIDESYLRLTGDFGDLRAGSTKSAMFVLSKYAPWAGLYPIGNPTINNFVRNPGPGAYTGFPAGVFGTDSGPNDNMKLTYFTPKWSGFQGGVSYSAGSRNTDNPVDTVLDGNEITADVAYDGKFGDIGFKADIGYAHTEAPGSLSKVQWRGGVNVLFAGWTVGGSYSDTDDNATVAGQNSQDATAWDVGIKYGTGPWVVALGYRTGERDATLGTTAATIGEDETRTVHFGANYSIGPGISLRGNIAYIEHEDETTAAAVNNEGWAAFGGVDVRF